VCVCRVVVLCIAMPMLCRVVLCIAFASLASARNFDPHPRRPFEPLARQSALRLLRQLTTEGCKDLVSVDIGGTLAKIVVFQPRDEAQGASEPLIAEAQRELSIYVPALGGDLYFFTFETRYMDDIIELIHQNLPAMCSAEGRGPSPIVMRATGGGAYKHAEALGRAGVQLDVGEEMSCIVTGLHFLLRNAHRGGCTSGEVYTLPQVANSPMATSEAYQMTARLLAPSDTRPDGAA